MHIVGAAILLGCLYGPLAMIGAPLFAVFGWFFILPEFCGVGLQWAIYEPAPELSHPTFLTNAFISAIAGGLLAGVLLPKEQGSEARFWIAGFLAGAGAAVFSLFCIHMLKRQK